jgi:SAM-dependent methyltransferase
MDRMSTVPEDGAVPTGSSRVNDYDLIAEGYTTENETSLANAYYDRPAILALAGDVAGRRILDAGCGSGPLSAVLRDQGAVVTGIDISAGMLELARRRLGDNVRLQQADLKSPLPFADNAFDDVIAALVLHYLEDWTAPLAELRRVLTPGGRLIVSVNHPSQVWFGRPGFGRPVYTVHREPGGKADYFATYSWTVPWTMGDRTAQMRFWHRPLHAMTDAFTGAGFRISVVSEPQPGPPLASCFLTSSRSSRLTRTSCSSSCTPNSRRGDAFGGLLLRSQVSHFGYYICNAFSRAGKRTLMFPAEIVPDLRKHLERYAEPGRGGLSSSARKAARSAAAISMSSGPPRAPSPESRTRIFTTCATRAARLPRPPARLRKN